MPKIYAVILAGGQGTRVGKNLPKQFLPLDDKSILMKSIERFHSVERIDNIIAVLPEDYAEKIGSEIINNSLKKIFKIVKGGETRQNSVYNAILSHNFDDDDILVFHDAARPFIDSGIILKTIEAAEEFGSAGAYIPAIDTISEIESGFVKSIPSRERLYYTQTPQAFLYKIIFSAHKAALSRGINNATDDVSLVVAAGHRVRMVEGSVKNIKITTEESYNYARYLSSR